MISIVKLNGDFEVPTDCNHCPMVQCETGDFGDYICRCSLQWDADNEDYKDVDQCCCKDIKDDGCPIISIEKVEAE